MEPLSTFEAKYLVDKMSTNKALAYDLTSDIIFSDKYKEKTSKIIKGFLLPINISLSDQKKIFKNQRNLQK